MRRKIGQLNSSELFAINVQKEALIADYTTKPDDRQGMTLPESVECAPGVTSCVVGSTSEIRLQPVLDPEDLISALVVADDVVWDCCTDR